MIQRVYLILKEIFSSRFISLIVLFSVLVSVITFALFNVIGNNFNSYIQNRFASSIPPNTIKVSAKTSESLVFFRARRPGAPLLNSRMLRRIRSIKGVKHVYPVMLTRVPMQAQISLFGFQYSTDLLCIGVPYNYIKSDLKSVKYRRLWLRPKVESNIPVIFPRILIKAYNDGMAEPNGLPKISEKFVRGIGFDLLFGYSSIRVEEDFIKTHAVVAGFTDKINTLAIIVPLKVARYYNKKFNENGFDEYLYAFVKVKDHKALLSVSYRIRKMGLVAEAKKRVSRSILSLKKNVNLLISFLMYLIIGLAIIAISFSSMIATLNRIEYYRILRILGASKYFISFTIILKYFLIGLGGSFLGLMLIEYFSNNITALINISVIKIALSIPEDLMKKIIIFGSIVPVISTLPGLIRLYIKGLNRD